MDSFDQLMNRRRTTTHYFQPTVHFFQPTTQNLPVADTTPCQENRVSTNVEYFQIIIIFLLVIFMFMLIFFVIIFKSLMKKTIDSENI